MKMPCTDLGEGQSRQREKQVQKSNGRKKLAEGKSQRGYSWAFHLLHIVAVQKTTAGVNGEGCWRLKHSWEVLGIVSEGESGRSWGWWGGGPGHTGC